MTRLKVLRAAAGVLALIVWLACPAVTSAGPLTLTIANGRVTLIADQVPLRQVLAEWERVGGLRIVNRDRVPGGSVTIELKDVPEHKALETLLRSAAGFVAVRWGGQQAGASLYSRIIVMPGTAAPLTAGGTSPAVQGGMPRPQPQVQRRVLPDGRVINFIDDANRPGDMGIADDTEDPANEPIPSPMIRPPFGAPVRPGQITGVGPGGEPDQAEGQPASARPPSAMPTMPTRSLPTPGVIPPAKPNPNQPPPPPRPIKPPDA